MALKVVNQPLANEVKSCTSDYKTRNKKRPKHNGMDLISKSSKDNYVIAVADGTISNVGYDSVSGYYVFIKHDIGVYTFYCHLKKSSTLVKKGQKVTKGTKLALMGNTGASEGTHLHYAVKKNGVWIDPKPSLEQADYFDVKPKYTKGTYEVISPRYVRVGAGTEYRIKKVAELTKDGQAHCVNKKATADAQYEKGTHYSGLEIITAKNGSIWARTPSGYVCIESSKGISYCKKIK